MFGIQFAIDFVTNSSQFTKSLKSAQNSAYKFFAEIGTQAAVLSNAFDIKGSGVELLEQTLKDSLPNAFKDSTAASKIAYAKMANEMHNSLSSIDESLNAVFGQTMQQAIAAGKTEMQNFQDSLLKLNPKNMEKLSTSMASFTKGMDKFNVKEIKKFSELLEEIEKGPAPEKLEKIAKEMDNINKKAENRAAIKKWASSFQPFIKSALGLYSVSTIFSQIMGTQNEMSKNVWDMGLASTNATREYTGLTKVMYGASGANASLAGNVRATTAEFLKMNKVIAGETQMSLRDVSASMGELMQMRVGRANGDLQALTKTSMQMQAALGMSNSSANRFIHSLSVIGGIGAKDIEGAAQGMLDVKTNLGLTEAEANIVGDTVGKLMRRFRTFGGSAKQVKTVTTEIGKMTAAFASVGLEAGGASDMIQKMMDPDNISQSIMLWNQMGISASQGMAMMHGDGTQMAGMTEKMVAAAKKLKAQYGGNIWALKAMAEANGMNLEQVQALSEYNTADLKAMKEKAKLEEAAADARQGLTQQLDRMKNSVLVMLQGALLPALQIMGVLFEAGAKAFGAFSKAMDFLNEKTGFAGSLIEGFMSVLLLGALGVIPHILKIGKMFGGIAGNIRNMVKGIGTFFSSMKDGVGIVGSVKDGLSTAFNKAKGPAGDIDKTSLLKDKPVTEVIDPKKVKGTEGAAKAMRSFPKASQLLALAVAIVAVGVAIGIIALSFSVLAKSLKELNPEQLLTLMGMAAIIMIGFAGSMAILIPIITALGAASVSLLPLAVVIFTIGAAIALITLSMSVLVNAIKGAGPDILAAGKGFLMMAGAMIGLVAAIGALVFMSPALAAVGISLAILATSMVGLAIVGKSVGNSLMNMGTGMQLLDQHAAGALNSMSQFKDLIKNDWVGAADQAVTEIEKMVTAMEKVQDLSPMKGVKSIVSGVLGKISAEVDSKKSTNPSDYNGRLDIMNENLVRIVDNTKDTVTILGDILYETKQNRPVRVGFLSTC